MVPQATGAQQVERIGHAVQGVVFDSVANTPLVGAVVHVAMRDAVGAPVTAMTDASGRYRVGGLAGGQYIVGFYHDALTVLGLDAPTQAVDLATDTLAIVNLAIPSSLMVRALRCGADSLRADRGMLVGFVRDAQSRAVIPSAAVRLEWGALRLDSANALTVTEGEFARIETDGAFAVCQLPLDVSLNMKVSAPGYHPLTAPVAAVPMTGIGRLDLLLVDSAGDQGAAVIRGSVRRASGKVVTSGRVRVKALKREAAIEDGRFTLANVPVGSWIIDVSAIGAEPQTFLIEATDSAVAPAAIALSDLSQRLDAVTVLGKMDRTTQVLEDVLRRSRYGAGSYFLPGNIHLRMAMYITDVMQNARGFRVKSDTEIVGRTLPKRPCGKPAIFLDDEFFPGGIEVLNRVISIKEVLAMETYPDIDFAPIRFQTGFGTPPPEVMRGSARRGASYGRLAPCAVIVVWTKRAY